MTYTPRPIDTTRVVLTPEILALTERLAEHIHDVWASGRLAEGWTYGPARDDAAKTLTSPFSAVVKSSNPWVDHGLPTILALVAYGVGLGYLARFASVRVH